MLITLPIESIVAAHSVSYGVALGEIGGRSILFFEESSEYLCFLRVVSPGCRYFVSKESGIGITVGMNGHKNIRKVIGRDGRREYFYRHPRGFEEYFRFFGDGEGYFPFGYIAGTGARIEAQIFEFFGGFTGFPVPYLKGDSPGSLGAFPIPESSQPRMQK